MADWSEALVQTTEDELESVRQELEGVVVPVTYGDKTLFQFDFDRWRANMSPARRRRYERNRKVLHWQQRIYRSLPWTRWPLLGFMYDFWTSVADPNDDPRSMLMFAYLNDGMKPSVWHTWQQVMHPGGEYDGIWPSGAPRNKAEADKEATPK